MPQTKQRKKDYNREYGKKNRVDLSEKQRIRRANKKLMKAQIEHYNRTNRLYSFNRMVKKVIGTEWEWREKNDILH